MQLLFKQKVRRKMHFTKRLKFIFREHISCCGISRHIYISPNKVVHCRMVCAYSPEFSEAWKYFETGGKKRGHARSLSAVITEKPRPSVPFSRKHEHISLPMDPDGASQRVRPWSSLAALRVSTRGTHMHACTHARVCVRVWARVREPMRALSLSSYTRTCV